MFQGNELVPKKMFFTKGIGVHREKLTSFEMALRDAGIARYNLVRVSSIFPLIARSWEERKAPTPWSPDRSSFVS